VRHSSIGSPPTPSQVTSFLGAAVAAKVDGLRLDGGKRGGARVIYFIAPDRTIWLLIAYKKAQFDNLPTSFLADLKQGVEDVL
jgi:hypothetical protein